MYYMMSYRVRTYSRILALYRPNLPGMQHRENKVRQNVSMWNLHRSMYYIYGLPLNIQHLHWIRGQLMRMSNGRNIWSCGTRNLHAPPFMSTSLLKSLPKTCPAVVPSEVASTATTTNPFTPAFRVPCVQCQLTERRCDQRIPCRKCVDEGTILLVGIGPQLQM